MKKIKEIIKMPFQDLRELLKTVEGTDTALQYLTASDTQVANYMSNFISKVVFFDSISEDCLENKEPFNIEKWLKSNKQSKLFLLNNVKDSDLNAIRISVFVNTIIKIILSMEENSERRVYFYLDEIGAAAQIDSLETALILGRSFGLTVIFGIQEIAKIDHIYGENIRKTMVNNLNTKIILRVSDYETANYLSQIIGESEVKEVDFNNVLNNSEQGGSLNVNRKSTQKLIVLPSEIQNLPDLSFYFKQPTMNWVKGKTTWKANIDKLENKFEPFIPCKAKLSFKKRDMSELELEKLKEDEFIFGKKEK